MVVDEAQNVKNPSSKIHECVRSLKARHTVLLTGTPLQNNTAELWSLLSLLDRKGKWLGTLLEFQTEFGEIKDQANVKKLQKIMDPFMLRRAKKEVLKDIPPKEETLVEVELTSTQKKFYRAIFERNRAFLTQGQGRKVSMPKLNNLFMQLRKCCNHPYLLDGVKDRLIKDLDSKSSEIATSSTSADKALTDKEDSIIISTDKSGEKNRQLKEGTKPWLLVNASGKMVLLHKLLSKLHANGHKVLIFSCFKVRLVYQFLWILSQHIFVFSF
jgi:SNF2 family DNA or RNA helicase